MAGSKDSGCCWKWRLVVMLIMVVNGSEEAGGGYISEYLFRKTTLGNNAVLSPGIVFELPSDHHNPDS